MNKSIKIMETALTAYGFQETLGGHTNPKLLELINDVSDILIEKNIPWCAAFVSHVLKKNKCKYSKTLTARSNLKIGRKVAKPSIGDIVILWRESPDSWKGHVGFFVKETPRLIYILGGNQNNTVCIKAYPKVRLLEYRTLNTKS